MCGGNTIGSRTNVLKRFLTFLSALLPGIILLTVFLMTPLAKLIHEKKFEFIDYLKTSVADFYVNPGHRWLVYTLTFIISGLGAFLAGFAYD